MSLNIYLVCKECGRGCYEGNVTHNLRGMAIAARVYECLWRAPENDFKDAQQLIIPLKKAISAMEKNPEKFKTFYPKNGWGKYDGFLAWLKELLDACREYPDARIETSR